ncbi:MAG: hypothetical protein AB9919_11800 [Geobacteraceae bacterium]
MDPPGESPKARKPKRPLSCTVVSSPGFITEKKPAGRSSVGELEIGSPAGSLHRSLRS